MKDNRSWLSLRLASIKRHAMWFLLAKKLNLILLTEYPKSGGTWCGLMVAELLEVPFPRNKTPRFETCLMHGHYRFGKTKNKTICMMRDGRDVMVSAYFHFLFEHDRNRSDDVLRIREQLDFNDYHDVENNLPAFIEYMFTKFKIAGRVANWADFVSDSQQNEVSLVVKYENLLKQPVKEIQRIMNYLNADWSMSDIEITVDKYSFNKLASRKRGEEDRSSFLRKGIAGDWKNYFNQRSKEAFLRYAGDELILMGYEKDSSWCQLK